MPTATDEQLSFSEILTALGEGGIFDAKGLVPEILIEIGDDEEKADALGSYLGAVNSATRFAVGDWLNFAEVNFGDRYSQMQHLIGVSLSTLRSWSSVAAAIPRVRRRTPEVSWSHHDAVATLSPDQQTKWLKRIHREGWTVEETREARRTADPETGEPGDRDPGLDHVGQSLSEVARSVWISASKHGDTYHVPAETMLRLARAIGERV